MRLKVGRLDGGMTPKRLLPRITTKSVNEQRHEPHESLAADEVLGDAVAHEAVDGLGAHLAPARHEGPLRRDRAASRDEDRERTMSSIGRVIAQGPSVPKRGCQNSSTPGAV